MTAKNQLQYRYCKNKSNKHSFEDKATCKDIFDQINHFASVEKDGNISRRSNSFVNIIVELKRSFINAFRSDSELNEQDDGLLVSMGFIDQKQMQKERKILWQKLMEYENNYNKQISYIYYGKNEK